MMSKLSKRIMSAVMAGFFVLSIAGCARENAGTDASNTIKIGVAIYRGDDAFIASLYNYLEEEVKDKEEEIGRKIILSMSDAKNNQGSQNDQVDDFIGKGYDAVCVNMVDRTVASVIADKAKEAKIPLIFFNREPVEEDMHIWDKTYYVGSDAKEAGELEGRIVADAWQKDPASIDKNKDGKIQYVMLEGEQVHQDALIRTEYSVKTIMDAGIQVEKLASGTANWMRSPAYEFMQEWIGTYGTDIELVISNNDEMALGALEALGEKGMTGANGAIVVGIDGTKDGLEKIAKGEMLGTVKNNAREQARTIIDIACSSAMGKIPKGSRDSVEDHYERIPHYIVTSENLEEAMDD